MEEMYEDLWSARKKAIFELSTSELRATKKKKKAIVFLAKSI
jgi:hypothetical protein